MSEKPLDITPVILAGGEGKRLRPLTTIKAPKPFLKLFDGKSLLQQTALRAGDCNAPVVICHERFVDLAAQHLRAVDIKAQIIGEPVGRSTAPAIALAAFALLKEDNPMLVMPSDHVVEDREAFARALEKASAELREDNLVFVAAKPYAPETRYGYIASNDQGNVLGFKEKPNAEMARDLLSRKNCFWNTGMFLVRPSHFLRLLQKHAPDIYKSAKAAFETAQISPEKIKIETQRYQKIRSAAVDYVIMENIEAAKIISLDSDWYDVGTWQTLLGLKLKKILRKS